MKATALAVSARKQGNCYDFARFTLNVCRAEGLETELSISMTISRTLPALRL